MSMTELYQPGNEHGIGLENGNAGLEYAILSIAENLSNSSTTAGETPEFIPDVGSDLVQVKEGVKLLLKALDDLLAHQNRTIFTSVADDYNGVVRKFMRIVEVYLGTTLMELFGFVDTLVSFMVEYEEEFETFVSNSQTIIDELSYCITMVEGLSNSHSQTTKDLSKISTGIDEIVAKYKDDSKQLSGDSLRTMIISCGMEITGLVAGASLAPIVSPLLAAGTGALISSGGLLGRLVAEYDQKKADIYNKAVANLGTVQNCCEHINGPIKAIDTKLRINKRVLMGLKKVSQRAIASAQSDGYRRSSYASAQKKAADIIRICDEISEYMRQISQMSDRICSRGALVSTSKSQQ
ncbi:hypothetical protein BGX26_004438 [Mortierella sp. AD094]|nr:hypothetical protein BGX26_004438 [Mortierella sp. AD094]